MRWIAIVLATIVVGGCGRSDNGVNAPDATADAAEVENAAADAAADANAAAGGAANEAATQHQWWTASADFATCIDGGSPAERVKAIHARGGTSVIDEQKDGGGNIAYVRVYGAVTGDPNIYRKYYPSEAGCKDGTKNENGTAAELQ